MGVHSAATTWASRNRFGASTGGPAFRADLAVRVDRRRDFLIPLLVGAASRHTVQTNLTLFYLSSTMQDLISSSLACQATNLAFNPVSFIVNKICSLQFLGQVKNGSAPQTNEIARMKISGFK